MGFSLAGGSASVGANTEASTDGSDVSVRAQMGVSAAMTGARQEPVVVGGVADNPAIAGEFFQRAGQE